MSNTSIVTITRNNSQYLDKYFEALYKNTKIKDFELVLIDNASSFAEAKHIDSLVREYEYYHEGGDKIKLIHNKEMKSFAANCNEGASQATGGFYMFLNDDTEVQPNWLDPLIVTASNDDGHYQSDRIAAVGPKMFFPNQMVQHCGIAFHKKDRMPGHIWWNKLARTHPRVNHPRRVSAITGGAMFIKSRIFQKLGGFDEVYKVCAYEDIDLCLRLKENNYILKYEPRSEILHHESVTQQKFDQKFRQDYFIQNTNTFLSRWYDKIEPDYAKMTYGEEE